MLTGQVLFCKLMSDVVGPFAPAAKVKGLKIRLKIDENLPKVMWSDKRLLRQILLNLVSNAVKFTSHGEITIGLEPSSSMSTFTVSFSDTGLGIKPSEQTKLFQPFTQANASLSRKFGGTGLGLDLSRKLARLLAGDLILVKSELGVGSTFNLNLPFQSTARPVLGDFLTVKAGISEQHSAAGMRLLKANLCSYSAHIKRRARKSATIWLHRFCIKTYFTKMSCTCTAGNSIDVRSSRCEVNY